MGAAIKAMHGHVLAVTSGGTQGKRLGPAELREISGCIRTLRGVKASKSKGAGLQQKDLKELMDEASKLPELKEALAAMGGQ